MNKAPTWRGPEGEAFSRGVDLAAKMLRQAQAIAQRGDDRVSIEARYRNGRPQDAFALRYLATLRACPELAVGFAAVLSDYLASVGPVDPEVYEDLAVAEMTGPMHRVVRDGAAPKAR